MAQVEVIADACFVSFEPKIGENRPRNVATIVKDCAARGAVVGMGDGECDVCGSDDSEHAVSVQGHAYVRLIKKQQSCCERLKASETFTCSDRSLVSDKLVNQPLYEEK